MSKKSEAVAKLRDLPDNELSEALNNARDEYFRMRLGNYTNQLQNPLDLRAKRREVARIMTVMHARKLDTAGKASQEA